MVFHGDEVRDVRLRWFGHAEEEWRVYRGRNDEDGATRGEEKRKAEDVVKEDM